MEQILSENTSINALKSELMQELREWVNKARQDLATMNVCTHNANDLNTIFKNVILTNKDNASKTHSYVKEQTKIINENVQQIFVAPWEGGKWKNWQSELYLEEKLFPALFPYGIGGYLSSNMLRQNNMGFANYVDFYLLIKN